MNAPTKLTIYALILAAVFTITYLLGGLIPEDFVNNWSHQGHSEQTPTSTHPTEQDGH